MSAQSKYQPRRAVLALLSLGLLLGALHSDAWGCTLKRKGETRFPIPSTLNLSRDLPIGSVIYDTNGWIGTGDAYVECMQLYPHYQGAGFISSPAEVKVPGKSDVYASALAGVGVRVAWSPSTNTPSQMEGGRMMRGERTRTSIPRDHYAPAQRFWVQLIKTGPIQSGTFAMPQVRIYYDDELTNELVFLPVPVVVTQRGCQVLNPSIEVPLPTANQHHFDGVGSSARPFAFDIKLKCDPDIKVSYQLDGLTAAASVLKNVIGPNMAQGIGVQLLKGDGATPLALGVKTHHLNTGTAGGPSMISLIARYYQLEPTVRPGQVLTAATLTLFYE
ncbi:fimbrial protein [Pseudomonas solani]|uniref:fimbrial protein n=1 Tax=Pseudomonas solani TaxID=2731552 RepID=UPI003D6ACB1B